MLGLLGFDLPPLARSHNLKLASLHYGRLLFVLFSYSKIDKAYERKTKARYSFFG